MDARQQVLRAVEARAVALANADSVALGELLHEVFQWTSQTGETFTRDDYIERNTGGVVEDVAVLRVEVIAEIATRAGPELFRMPMTQVWVRQGDR